MKTLRDYISESIVDLDQDHDVHVIATAWADENLSECSYKITQDGKIIFNNHWDIVEIKNDNIPKGVSFVDVPNLKLMDCSKIDMGAFESITISISCENCNFKQFRGSIKKLEPAQPSYKNYINLSFVDCKGGENLKWIPVTTKICVKFEGMGSYDVSDFNIEQLSLMNGSYKVQAGNIYSIEARRIDDSNFNFKNIKFNQCIDMEIVNCKIKNLDGISNMINNLTILACSELKSLKGLEKVSLKTITLDRCPELDNSDYLPKSLESIRVHQCDHRCWVTEEIKDRYPHISKVDGLPLSMFDVTLGGKIKPGLFGAVRSAAKTHGLYGASRGSLVLDQIKKIGKTVNWEICKSRQFEDFILMDDDANPKKDWSYVDPKGFNDCTGVGIEVGDEVAVYCASGSYGAPMGVEKDTVIGFTPKMVKTKMNGNRPGYDICILRPHKIAKMFFEK